MEADGDDIAKAQRFFNDHEYEVIAQVGQGVALPSESNYTVKIMIADNELQTDKPQSKEGNYCRWNHRFE